LIGLHLDFNQVGNLNRALDFREIQTLAFPDVMIAIDHWVIYLILGDSGSAGVDVPFGQNAGKERNATQQLCNASCP
jgi:hypothetical protein